MATSFFSPSSLPHHNQKRDEKKKSFRFTFLQVELNLLVIPLQSDILRGAVIRIHHHLAPPNVNKEIRDLQLPPIRSPVKRGLPVLIPDIHKGPLPDQKLADGEVSLLGGPVERCPASPGVLALVRVRPLRQQGPER